MRKTLLLLLLSALCPAAPIQAGDEVPVEAPQNSSEKSPVQLGGGIVLPREVFDQLSAREDGLAMIERMQNRAEDSRRFEGMPHIMVVFAGVLVFFWSAMIYYQRKHARLHRTIQLMIEKGMPLPLEILRAAETSELGGESLPAAGGGAPAQPVWASNLLWGGILWITIGITGTLYLWIRENDAWPWGIAAVIYGFVAVGTAYGKQSAAR